MNDLLILKKNIENLTEKQQLEIFKILNKFNINYSENNNGIFFNLANLPIEHIDELQNYIKYINDQETTLLELENMKDELTKVYFNIDKNAIKDSNNTILSNEFT